MKTKLIHISLIILVSVIMSTNASAKDKREKFHDLHHDIVLLNLINGLYLTPEQTESLLDKIKAAEQAREDFIEEIDRRKNEIEDVLEDVRKVLWKGEEIPDELKKRVHRMNQLRHQLEDERGEKLVALESEVENLLTQNQLITIEEYKPCTIPPEEGKIGQSVETAAKGIVRMLTRIRRMPSERFRMMKEMIADMSIEKVERHVGFKTPEEKEAYRHEIYQAFEKARNLSDQEFMVQKGDLAQNLLPDDAKLRKLRKNQLSKVGVFLLDPTLIPILEDRL